MNFEPSKAMAKKLELCAGVKNKSAEPRRCYGVIHNVTSHKDVSHNDTSHNDVSHNATLFIKDNS